MSEHFHFAADRGPAGQLTLGLAVALDPPTPLRDLTPGDRFLLETAGTEGKLVNRGPGSATVALLTDDRWTRTTWSLATLVRRLRG